MKGLLVLAAVRFPKTHDMDALAELVLPAFPELAPLLDRVRPLTVWSVAFRYPAIEDVDDAVPDTDSLDATLVSIGRLAEALVHRLIPNG